MAGRVFAMSAGVIFTSIMATSAWAASRPPVSLALGLKPVQSDVDFDVPTSEQFDKCSVKSEVNDARRPVG